jgi:carbonic anhydrase
VPINRMLAGYRAFKEGSFTGHELEYSDLASKGQNPGVAVIACSDSRVDPAFVFRAEPGEIFMIRNVANLVPPMEEGGTFHGTSAALEFAVKALNVPNIVVLGHAHCGGIKAMIDGEVAAEDSGYSYVPAWVSILSAAYRRAIATQDDLTDAEMQKVCEQNAVLVSLENLTTFPWIRERIADKRLKLHGWYFDIGTATLEIYDSKESRFRIVD